MYGIAGSGIALGVFTYMNSEKKCVQTSWTTNFEPSVKWDYNWDKRDLTSIIKPAKNEDDVLEQNRVNEEKEKFKPTAFRHLILIRHGQYEMTGKTDEDRKLTLLGRKQADAVAKRLKDLGYNYTKLTRSTMTRAMETSDIILEYFPDIPTETDDMLREGSPIPPEPPSGSWRPEHQQFFKDGARIEAAFRKYFHRADSSQKVKNSYEIIVCHANVIRYFVCRALQFPPEAWLRFSLYHCSITWITISPSGKVGVYAIGDHGFIPRDTMSV